MALAVDDLTALKQRDATLEVVRTYLPPSLVSNLSSIDKLGLSGTEREISILIADVRGFTAFSELLPPEDLMAVITQYLAVSTDALQLFDGIVDKYLGDAVVGLFNTAQPAGRPRRARRPRRADDGRRSRARTKCSHDSPRLRHRRDDRHGDCRQRRQPDRRGFTALGPRYARPAIARTRGRGDQIIAATYAQVESLFAAERSRRASCATACAAGYVRITAFAADSPRSVTPISV